jgi:hypothetical protein
MDDHHLRYITKLKKEKEKTLGHFHKYDRLYIFFKKLTIPTGCLSNDFYIAKSLD